MMKIAGVCVIGCLMCIILKRIGKGEMALVTSLSIAVYAFYLCFDEVKSIMNMLEKLSLATNLDSDIYKAVIKITGIAYITETASELCKDSGEGALAGKVEFGGKILICATAMPMVAAFFTVISDIL